MGIKADEIFVSDGAQCDISRLQVSFVYVANVQTHYISRIQVINTLFSVLAGFKLIFHGFPLWQMLLGPNVTVAVQDPSFPVSFQ